MFLINPLRNLQMTQIQAIYKDYFNRLGNEALDYYERFKEEYPNYVR